MTTHNSDTIHTLSDAIKLGEAYTDRQSVREIITQLLHISTSRLIGFPETPIPQEMWVLLQSSFERARSGEPIPYITGIAYFYGYAFHVTPDTLIPRPETEQLVSEAAGFLRARQGATVIDIGTGSGCIPITLAQESHHHRPHILASDISIQALRVAQQNGASLNEKEPITFLQADLLSSFPDTALFDTIIANLPYVATEERPLMDQHVLDYEPHLALFSEDHGLAHIKRLLRQAHPRLKSNGLLLLEFGFQQGDAIYKAATRNFPNAKIEILKDLAGHDRILKLRQGG